MCVSPHGYFIARHTPGLWLQKTRPIDSLSLWTTLQSNMRGWIIYITYTMHCCVTMISQWIGEELCNRHDIEMGLRKMRM
jgi:hypothetical protein